MGLSLITWVVVIIMALFLLISEFYINRRLNIKRPRVSIFSKGRKKVYIVFEIALIILSLIAVFTFLTYFPHSAALRNLPILLFFFSLSLLRGIEEWIVKKSDRGYYHEWSVSITFLIIIVFIIVVEMVR
ncbi:DUF4181 domain-containing protein [Anaerobacillus sp. MEB173]|uniref:DUF4181 domain-containing protein n=1 Tax=Anaerobacillus sp. MEB173 TaxID=3383345 RepID=UPI003F8F80D2